MTPRPNAHLLFSAVPALVRYLQTQATVYAPHRFGDTSYRFDQVLSPDAVVLDYNRTLQSIKKYFLPPRETLLSFSLTEATFEPVSAESSFRIFLGVHSYDLQALLRLDYNFTHGHPESNYLKRRENCAFVGVSFEPDEVHFSRSVGITVEEMEGFDLFLDRQDDGYAVFFLTDRGKALLEGFTEITKARNQSPVHREFRTKIKYNYNRLSEVFDQAWDSPVWEEVAERCVGCGTCNLVCPTCYCFTVDDEVNLTLTEGIRKRTWDGCMLSQFAQVAGGENFRYERSARQRHRVYRKFKYLSDPTGRPWCVGCGRCTAYCTARISIVDIVNQLCEDYEQRILHKNALV
ncbi:MAG: hypothetical protein GXO90_03775 [FCB group bacterium]|nr:hypothetical protein [FCB group bacterium]